MRPKTLFRVGRTLRLDMNLSQMMSISDAFLGIRGMETYKIGN